MNIVVKKMKDLANKITGKSVVDNEANPNSALNKKKNSASKPSWQARQYGIDMDKAQKNTKVYGTPLK